MTRRADLPHLADMLVDLGHRLKRHGFEAWDLAHSWEYGPRQPAATGERGGGTAGSAVEDLKQQNAADRKAAAALGKLRTIAATLHQGEREMQRLLDDILANHKNDKHHHDDRTAAQVAVEGWCVSCWRDDQTLVPIEKRPTGEPFWRDRCRWCGSFRAEHGQDPPLELLRLRHDGRRINQTQVDAALNRKRSA